MVIFVILLYIPKAICYLIKGDSKPKALNLKQREIPQLSLAQGDYQPPAGSDNFQATRSESISPNFCKVLCEL